jgi:hypothetical protein
VNGRTGINGKVCRETEEIGGDRQEQEILRNRDRQKMAVARKERTGVERKEQAKSVRPPRRRRLRQDQAGSE